MSRARHVQLSKRMSFLLRHRPQSAGLELDGAGWIGVDDFLRGVNSGGSDFTLADVEEVVATSDVSGNFNAGDFCLGTELVFQRNGYVTRSVIVTSLTERIALSDISKD